MLNPKKILNSIENSISTSIPKSIKDSLKDSFEEKIKNKGLPKFEKDIQNLFVNVGLHTFGEKN